MAIEDEVGAGTVELAGYRMDRELRRNATGTDYRAEQLDAGRIVTVKVLAPQLTRTDPLLRRVGREARALAQLSHPHVLPVLHVGDQENPPYLAMDHVEGEDLDTVLATGGAMDLGRTVTLIGQVAAALDAAHEEGLTHRGVAAGHIMIRTRPGGDAHCYLTDFGLSEGLAPEQLEGDPVDGRADVYGLGCVLQHCLTGEPPFADPDPDTVRRRHLTEPPARITIDRPDLPPAVDTVLATALAKQPERRYATCGSLAEALRVLPPATSPGSAAPAGTTQPFAAPPAGPGAPPPGGPATPPQSRPRRGLVAVLLAVGLGIVTLVTVLLVRDRFPNEQEAALLESVPASFRDTCSRAEAGVVVRCTPDQGAADLVVEQFETGDAMSAGYERVLRRANVPTDAGNCGMGTGAEHAYAGPRPGRVVCFLDGTTAAVVAWTDDERRTLATASAPTEQAGSLSTWWTGLAGLPPPAPFPTADEQALLDQLLEKECERADDLAMRPGARAAVRCTALTEEAESVRYYQFDEEAALQAVFAEKIREVGAPEGASCTQQPPEFLAVSPWSIGGITVGRALCHTSPGGQAVMEWSHNGLRILGAADGPDPVALTRYWFRTTAVFPALTDAVPFPTPQEQALLDRVPAPVRAECIRYESPPGLLRNPSEVAAVGCEPASGALVVIYKSFSDLDGMRSGFDVPVLVLGAPEGVSCATTPTPFLGVSDYLISGERAGRLLCFTLPDGTPIIGWTNEALLITTEAVGLDAAELLDWWRGQAGPWPPA